MAEHKTNFKLYLTDGNTNKTLTESHPKLSADNTAFAKAGSALMEGFNLELTEATVQSETTVYTAS